MRITDRISREIKIPKKKNVHHVYPEYYHYRLIHENGNCWAEPKFLDGDLPDLTYEVIMALSKSIDRFNNEVREVTG